MWSYGHFPYCFSKKLSKLSQLSEIYLQFMKALKQIQCNAVLKVVHVKSRHLSYTLFENNLNNMMEDKLALIVLF